MSDFLTDLEAQLTGAHPRRRAARRRKAAGRVLREAPVVLLVLAVLGGAVAFVTQVGSGDPGTAPVATTPPAAATPEPTFTASDPALPADSVVVLNASGIPGRGQAVAEVVRLRRSVAAVGTAPERLRRSVVAFTYGNGKLARRVANGLGLELRALRDLEPVAARQAGVAVLVGEDVLSAEVRALQKPGGGQAGRVGQIQRVGEGRMISVRAEAPAQTTVELRPCPTGAAGPRASCQIGVLGPGARDGFVSFGVRFAGRTVALRRSGRDVARAQLAPTVSRAIRSQAVSVLDTVARQPRGGRTLTLLLQRETTTARYAWTPPAIARTSVEYAPGAEEVASRIARRFGTISRPFGRRLTRLQAGLEAGVALRLGKDFYGSRVVRFDRTTVSVVRLRDGRRIVVAEVQSDRGSQVQLLGPDDKEVARATNTSGRVDLTATIRGPLPQSGEQVEGPLTVVVDGRRIGLAPLD